MSDEAQLQERILFKIERPLQVLTTISSYHPIQYPIFNMQPPFPSPTATWHNDTYSGIDPSNSALSQAGKTIIITGAVSSYGTLNFPGTEQSQG